MEDKIYIFGTGGHACKAYQYSKLINLDVIAFVDEICDVNCRLAHVNILLKDDLKKQFQSARIFVAIGNPDVRKRLIEEFRGDGWEIVSIIHPSAYVASDASLGAGVFVGANAVIETNSIIGEGSIIDIGALVDHDSTVASYTHVKPGEVVGPGSKIKS